MNGHDVKWNSSLDSSAYKIPFRYGLLTFLLAMLVTLGILSQILTVMQQENRLSLMRETGAVQTAMKGTLDSRLLLIEGLVSYVKMHPDISQADFTLYTGDLVGQDKYIRTVGLIKDTTVIYVYPVEGNEAVVGVDLAAVPEQRDDILKVRDTGNSLIIGPVELIQGGQAIIYRVPIFLESSDSSQGIYWGQASMVLNIGVLMEDIESEAPPGFRFWVRNAPAENASSKLVWGDPSMLDSAGQPRNDINGTWETYCIEPGFVGIDIAVPGGIWELYAINPNSINNNSHRPLGILAGGLAGAIFTSFLIGYLILLRNKLRNMAYFDPLTELPNRILFYERFEISSRLSMRNGNRMGIFMIDLDKFKEVNDTYGHFAGDQLLKAVARRLQSHLRDSDTISRAGGDEFVVLCPLVDSEYKIDIIIDRLENSMREPFQIDQASISVSFSLGAATFPDDSTDLNDLIKKADEAMYDQKRQKSVMQGEC